MGQTPKELLAAVKKPGGAKKSKKGKKPRKPRFVSLADLQIYNANKRKYNLMREIERMEKKLARLIKRYQDGKMRTPGKQKLTEGKEIVKIILKPRHQGIKPDSIRYRRMLSHIQHLKNELQESV